MKKLLFIFFIVECIVFNNNPSFAYNTSSMREFRAPGSPGYDEVVNKVYMVQLLDLQNINVKFTQDNNNYIFSITASANIKPLNSGIYAKGTLGASGVGPMLYSTENFGKDMYIEESDKDDFGGYIGPVYTQSSLKIQGKLIGRYKYSYTTSTSGARRNEESIDENTGELYYVSTDLRSSISHYSGQFKYATSYPNLIANNGAGISVYNNSSSARANYNSNDFIDDYTMWVNCKIGIKKQYIDNYRYICFGQTYALATDITLSDIRSNVDAYSLCTNTIDLKQYAECNHNWEFASSSRTQHIRKCNNCEWEVKENHKYIYEYDGIKKNICDCRAINKVNYHIIINDDYTGEYNEKLNADSTFNTPSYKNKTGYKFLYFDVYEKKLVNDKKLSTISNAIKVIHIATKSEISNKTGYNSMIYEARYVPNKFTIQYSNINNKNIGFDDMISDQIVTYDEKQFLKKNLDVKGYIFKGWTLNSGSENINFYPLQEITNYTPIDNEVVTVYPVYSDLSFSIIYEAGNYYLSDGSKYKEVKYIFNDDKELEKFTLLRSDEYLICYSDAIGNKFKNMTEIKQYLIDNNFINSTIKLNPVVGKPEYGRSERASSDKKDITSEIRLDNIGETKTPISDNEIIDGLDELLFLDLSDIYGMSYSKIVKEEDVGNKENKNLYRIASTSYINAKVRKRELSKKEYLLNLIKENKTVFYVSICLIGIIMLIYETMVIYHFIKRKK